MRAVDGERHFDRGDAAFDAGFRDFESLFAGVGAHDGDKADVADAVDDGGFVGHFYILPFFVVRY